MCGLDPPLLIPTGTAVPVQFPPMGLRERVRLRTRLRALRANGSGAAATTTAPATAPAVTTVAEPESDYERRLAQESARFAEDLNVHDLPPIFHYWSNKHLLPVLQSFGFNSADELFANTIAERAARLDRPARVLSMGAGNCDTEVRVARLLLDRGIEDFTLTCMELVPEMLERGRALAYEEGVTERMEFIAADINAWTGEGDGYDVIIANQFLHHVVELEQLFDHVLELLAPDGCFVTSDMIGRNGHQRWPEAKGVLDEFWAELPDSYRYHVLLQRQEQEYLDWDCSQQGFEGIRSQDVLPLLDERFGFELFIGFGSIIDPFIDRGFGHHFDPDAEWDRDFIDRVQARDDELLDAGVLTPTHVMAIMVADKGVTPRIWRDRTVQSSIRDPGADVTALTEVRHCWPLGHYYSPVPDTRVLSEEPTRSRVWPDRPPPTPGIDWRDGQQVALVRELGRQDPMVFPTSDTGDPADYHTDNEMFAPLDAWFLQGMLRHHRPARVIEVGCGWSSLVTARVNREHFGGSIDFTCIEPYPPEFLGDGIDGIDRLIVSPVQDVPIERFRELGENDVLFIDTAHVIKTGGDVQYLYHHVIPNLRSGVVIHIHDIFLPWDYPKQWVLDGRGWNEQYLLQSFLSFNSAFEIRAGVAWMNAHHRDVLAEAVPGYPTSTPDSGGSFWLQRVSG